MVMWRREVAGTDEEKRNGELNGGLNGQLNDSQRETYEFIRAHEGIIQQRLQKA